MLKQIKEMMTAAVNRVAVIIVSSAANKIEAAAALGKAEIDAELETEARRLEAEGLVSQAQKLRLQASSIQTNAPAATALPALANLVGETESGIVASPSIPQWAMTASEDTPKRGPGRPPKPVDSGNKS